MSTAPRLFGSLALAALLALGCSVLNDLEELKSETDGGTADAAPAAKCEPGDCSGCVGCVAFCTCGTTSQAAREQCLATACGDSGTGDAAGSGGSSGAGGAGSGGNSGSGGASASGGGSGTGGASSLAQCQKCATDKCSAELQKCSSESECIEILGCAVNCTQITCVDACVKQSPGGAAAFEKLRPCLEAECPSCGL